MGVYVGSLLHNHKAEEMFNYIIRAGVDIRPESMDITWEDMGNALIKMKEYINKIGLWHSIAHDKVIDEKFVADLKRDLSLVVDTWQQSEYIINKTFS